MDFILGGKKWNRHVSPSLAQAFTCPPTEVTSCQQFCFSEDVEYVPSENPASLLLGDVHPKARTDLEILDLAGSHRNYFPNQCIVSFFVASHSVHKTLCSPTLALPLQLSLGILEVISIHNMLGRGWSILLFTFFFFYQRRRRKPFLFVSHGKI